MTAELTVSATTLVAGRSAGPVMVLAEPLSFWGGFDARDGRIIDRWHPQLGDRLAGVILLMTAGRGSSSGSSVLAEAIRRGTGPAGIVLASRDAIVTIGALVATALYARSCPIALVKTEDWQVVRGFARARVDADAETARITGV